MGIKAKTICVTDFTASSSIPMDGIAAIVFVLPKRCTSKTWTGYLKANPNVKKFKLHNFRGTAMSRARMAGVSYDDAAVAFGCNPQTMRQHYIALDETEISDRVMDKIQGKNGEKNGEKHDVPSPQGNRALSGEPTREPDDDSARSGG